MGSHSLMQGIFLTQGSNPHLLHWQAGSLPLFWTQGQFSSVTQSYPTLCDPVDYSTTGFPVHHKLPDITHTHVHPVSNAIQPSPPCHPLLLLSIFPSIRVFSSESVLRIRWPEYWSCSFSISPSSEHSGLISCRTDWRSSPCCPGQYLPC